MTKPVDIFQFLAVVDDCLGGRPRVSWRAALVQSVTDAQTTILYALSTLAHVVLGHLDCSNGHGRSHGLLRVRLDQGVTS